MEKLKILVVEDEVIIADHLAETLIALGYEVPEPALNYTEAIASIEADQPDLAMLDIQLSGRKSGIDIARKINEEYHFPFIFLTSNSDKATLDEAKLVEPAAFLVKPYTKEELFAAIEVAIFNFAKQKENEPSAENLMIKNALFIKQNKQFLRLDFKDIMYLESDHVYLDIQMVNGHKHTVRGSMDEYLQKLGPGFVRSHRSFIVNLDHLQGLDHAHVTVNGQELPLGKKQREEIIARLNKG